MAYRLEWYCAGGNAKLSQCPIAPLRRGFADWKTEGYPLIVRAPEILVQAVQCLSQPGLCDRVREVFTCQHEVVIDHLLAILAGIQ